MRFQAPLDTCLGSPFFASLSVHGLHFMVSNLFLTKNPTVSAATPSRAAPKHTLVECSWAIEPRQTFMSRVENWWKNWAKNRAKFSVHVRGLFAVQNDPSNVSQSSLKFITPCLAAEMSEFHLREFLGLGGPK